MMERFEIGLSSGTVHTEIGSLDDQYCKGNDKDCGVATRAWWIGEREHGKKGRDQQVESRAW